MSGVEPAPATVTGQPEGLSSPRAAAALLGVSPSGLRRLAEIYASVCGELPRDPNTRSRLWPETALAELSGARDLVLANRASSIREALESIRRGENQPAALERRRDKEPYGDVAAEVIAELRELRSELAGVRTELAQVREIAGELSRRLDTLSFDVRRIGAPSFDGTGRRPRDTPTSEGSRQRIDPRERELHELRRRLSYLQAELELREI